MPIFRADVVQCKADECKIVQEFKGLGRKISVLCFFHYVTAFCKIVDNFIRYKHVNTKKNKYLCIPKWCISILTYLLGAVLVLTAGRRGM